MLVTSFGIPGIVVHQREHVPALHREQQRATNGRTTASAMDGVETPRPIRRVRGHLRTLARCNIVLGIGAGAVLSRPASSFVVGLPLLRVLPWSVTQPRHQPERKKGAATES